MRKIALIAVMLVISFFSSASLLNKAVQQGIQSKEIRYQLMGSPVYIQIFKEERILELWVKMGEQYSLLNSYDICNFSGGLGPKRREGDFKSPEGFYSVERSQLKPDSRYYKAMNLGFPNEYDRYHGYEGKYLMIHGACVSMGCYAMTDTGIDEIFQFVTAALIYGQPQVQISIFPFRMTDANMARHKYSDYLKFWQELKPGYEQFVAHQRPPTVTVENGRYIVTPSTHVSAIQPQLVSNYQLPKTK